MLEDHVVIACVRVDGGVGVRVSVGGWCVCVGGGVHNLSNVFVVDQRRCWCRN